MNHEMPEDVRRLMGLGKEMKILEGAAKEQYLPSVQRRKAFDNIDAETGPRKPHVEKKKGIVSAVLERGLLNEEVLKQCPTVYLGSGADVEYPLALGSRHTILVDYRLSMEKVLPFLAGRLKAITGAEPRIKENRLTAEFDFGAGPEEVTFEIEAKYYNPDTDQARATYQEYVLPEKVGLILEYAPHGPMGGVTLEEGVESKIVEGGAILDGDKLRINRAGKLEETGL